MTDTERIMINQLTVQQLSHMIHVAMIANCKIQNHGKLIFKMLCSLTSRQSNRSSVPTAIRSSSLDVAMESIVAGDIEILGVFWGSPAWVARQVT